MNLTESQLMAFLKDALGVEEVLDYDSELFSSGILDSVAMMNLILFVEEKAGITVNPGDVTLDNFDSVARILAYVTSEPSRD